MSRALEFPPKAKNVCPDCGHQPVVGSHCFGARIMCFDWRGDEVPCLCVNDAHFPGAAVVGCEHGDTPNA